MEISLIVAMGSNGEIGKNNDLLWNLPVDMRFFKDTTLGRTVVMGRKNYESIPPKYRPLPKRTNIVVSRNPDYEAPECYVCPTLQNAIELAAELGEEHLFIIGGAQIYDLALNEVDLNHLFITHVEAEFPDAEAFFPKIDFSKWSKTIIHTEEASITSPFRFQICRYDKA
jgi:dihydrofolate reductase